jgi:hypothetical protein
MPCSRFSVACLTWSLSLCSVVVAEVTTNPVQLAEMLGTPSDWKITPSGQGLYLESAVSKSAPGELIMSFRLKPAAGAAYVSIQMACAERPDKTQQA